MTPRFRSATALLLGPIAASLALVGCGDFNAGPIRYTDAPSLTRDATEVAALKDKPNLKGKPKLQKAVRDATAKLFGDDPRHMIVPVGLKAVRDGGAHLAQRYATGDDLKAAPKRMKYTEKSTGNTVSLAGGYSLYRKHCIHCHGVTGDGNGPTAEYLWPRPRNYQPGIFKFTSTTASTKPTREDLRRILVKGISNNSMPSFEQMMTPAEIDQVVDYVIFLSARGQGELNLINVASLEDEDAAEKLFNDESVKEAIAVVLDGWNNADAEVLNPPAPRVPTSAASVKRGREMFLGKTSHKLECAGCHGAQGKGDGPSFVAIKDFYELFSIGHESGPDKLREFADKAQKKWGDEWGMPLRPANLNTGVYKGGRRPLDLYWRIAKGINGTPMPSHASILKPDEIWDVINFVLALPSQPNLLKGAEAGAVPPTDKMATR